MTRLYQMETDYAPDPDPDHMDWIDYCTEYSDRLTDWEANFIDSLQAQMDDGRPLTAKQGGKLEEVWERVQRRVEP